MSGHPTQDFAVAEWKARYEGLKVQFDELDAELTRMIETNESLMRLCAELTEARDRYKAELDAREDAT